MENYRVRFEEIKNAPRGDLKRLLKKYGVTLRGFDGLADALLGSFIEEYARQVLSWYERLSPLFEGDGSSKSSPSELPEILIRKSNIDVNISAGGFSGTINNITPDQALTGLPITFEFQADSLEGAEKLSLEGSINHIDEVYSIDELALKIEGYGVRDVVLSENGELKVVIRSGLIDIVLDAAIKGDNLAAAVSSSLRSASIEASAIEGSGKVLTAVTTSLESVESFGIRAGVTADVVTKGFDVEISSDLEEVVRGAVAALVRDEIKVLRAELTEEIAGRVELPIAEASIGFDALGLLDQELLSRLDIGEGLVSEALKTGSPLDSIKLPF